MIGNYWNSAWRNLMKRKKFSFTLIPQHYYKIFFLST